MRPARFQEFAVETLLKAPDVKAAEPWQEEGRPFGIHVTFSTGSQLWAAITAASTSDKYDRPEVPVIDVPPAEVPVPDLYDDGKITPSRAEQYLAAMLTNAGNAEIAQVYTYTSGERAAEPNNHPGVGLVFHSESRIFVLFQHTARAGQGKGGQPFDLQSAF
ncbi:hypothetical protein ACFVH0_35910 [Streptomyces sp. NPDC127117]|uniref:hypothetical protein n=1 Tax=Streptomyces sp. NPDC127117 TaxID=3345368 RepID=UPI00363BCA42